MVGSLYRLGLGVSANGSEAVKWYRRSSEQGSALAYWNLGTLYSVAMPGVEPDPEVARLWKEKAIELGFDMVPSDWRNR